MPDYSNNVPQAATNENLREAELISDYKNYYKIYSDYKLKEEYNNYAFANIKDENHINSC